MRNFTDEPVPRSVRDDDEYAVRARPELSWMSQQDWRGSRRPRRDIPARSDNRAGILIGSLLGIGALAAVGIYAAGYMDTPELNPTAVVTSTESVDPYAGTAAVPAHIGIVPGASTPSSDAPAGIPDSDAPATADASEPEAPAGSSEATGATDSTGQSAAPATNTEGWTGGSDASASQPSVPPSDRPPQSDREERAPGAVPPPEPTDTLSDDPDAYRPSTPENTAPSRSTREGAPSVQEWTSDNPY